MTSRERHERIELGVDGRLAPFELEFELARARQARLEGLARDPRRSSRRRVGGAPRAGAVAVVREGDVDAVRAGGSRMVKRWHCLLQPLARA